MIKYHYVAIALYAKLQAKLGIIVSRLFSKAIWMCFGLHVLCVVYYGQPQIVYLGLHRKLEFPKVVFSPCFSCNTSTLSKATVDKGQLCLGLNNAFAFTQYSKMFPPFVRCMHPMCFLMVGTTWRLKFYFNIHHFLIPLVLMLINFHLWILLAFQYTQINSFISSRKWFWHFWCNCIHCSQMYTLRKM